MCMYIWLYACMCIYVWLYEFMCVTCMQKPNKSLLLKYVCVHVCVCKCIYMSVHAMLEPRTTKTEYLRHLRFADPFISDFSTIIRKKKNDDFSIFRPKSISYPFGCKPSL